ncbi:DUF4192 domain-containing protein [Streptomyces sp. S.PNR 29]|uniref:DUF4192 domain-containing protein n=1 Tax=Streptomyces sp. S.PNR 29 TaxID=2973805 RepID=UPI0025B2569F|nr:DUF4192 domain-containing protein [Streptomyces sp. S.PNR 29]MDN0193948.1 DUF4192 domain-containing protein [Streptomyces sp. S.PNR 29]
MKTPNPRIKVDGPADFAQLLPFLVGHQPEDCIALHGRIATQSGTGPTMTLSLPDDPATWQATAAAFAAKFTRITHEHGHPDILDIVVFLCRTPRPGQSAEETAEALRPLADYFVDAFTDLGRAPVMSTIALVDNRWWAYECHLPGCCEGEPLPSPDDPTSVAAQLARHGWTPGRRTSEITQEFQPEEPEDAEDLRRALDNEGAAWAQYCANPSDDDTFLQGTHALVETAIRDFGAGANELAHDITARLIHGLNDEWARDHGLEHIEDDELPHARRLWAFLARRAIPPYEVAAVPALTLLAAVAWRQDDIPTARYALKRALTLDPDDDFADALHEAINHEVDATSLLPIARKAKAERHARAEQKGRA